MSLNKCMIIGNLGRDPEMRYTPSGQSVTQFTVAVNRNYKDAQGERQEETEWFRVVAWGQQAEFAAEYLRKGNKVFVEGRFKTREFEGRDGQKRTSLDITADSIVNLERRGRDDEGQFGGPAADGGAASGGQSGGGRSGGGGQSGDDGGRSGGVRPGRPPTDDTELDDLPF